MHYGLIFFFGKNKLGNCVYVAFGVKESLSDLAEDAAPVFDVPVLEYLGEQMLAFWSPTFLALLICWQALLLLLNRLVLTFEPSNIFHFLCREEVVRSGLLFL